MVLEHLFVGAVMSYLWLDGVRRVEMLKSQVDNSGYDLVLETNSITRHIQLKASHHGAATPGANVNIALAEKVSGCVIWMYFDPATLAIGPYLWFGEEPGQKLGDLSPFRVAKHTKRNAQYIKTERPNIRYIPKAQFKRVDSIEDLVVRLFGPKETDAGSRDVLLNESSVDDQPELPQNS